MHLKQPHTSPLVAIAVAIMAIVLLIVGCGMNPIRTTSLSGPHITALETKQDFAEIFPEEYNDTAREFCNLFEHEGVETTIALAYEGGVILNIPTEELSIILLLAVIEYCPEHFDKAEPLISY